ncbi:hypothetical protein JKF63_01716 [Porcisia hertigi]|uniref:Phospholipid/glycerol acyltransferase domain-containing protein n=1 Tax=Porcisia hertigi TaxID=2761500 RepID=A0A836HLN7_9TRYP|nr:hypothetical protein JKF63_01716 [Porcisia hertigi]
MSFPPARLSLPEECKQVVLVAPIDGLTATCACALATSPHVPLSCQVLVKRVPVQISSPSSYNGNLHAVPSSPDVGAATRDFMSTVQQVESKMCASRATRSGVSVSHMTQFFYGDISPKVEEIGPMLSRIRVLEGGVLGKCDVAASSVGVTAASDRNISAPRASNSLFVLVLSAQSLGTNTEIGLKGYEALLRRLWSDADFTHAAETASQRTRVRGSLVILADDVYRTAACQMLSRIAKGVVTPVNWVVLLAYAHALDPPALEFGATEVAVRSSTGISHGGTLPILCAANIIGVLRHFPVSRSEPATITPVDVALNAALLGHIYLRHGELPACEECATELQYDDALHAPPFAAPAAAAGAATVTSTQAAPCATQHNMASFAVAESRRPGEASLVWGMVGEYLMCYYSRYAEQILDAFPVADILTPAPLLQFPFSVADVANFGPEPRAATYALEGWRAYRQRQRIMESKAGSAEATHVLKACVAQMESTVRFIESIACMGARRDKASSAPAASHRRAASSSFSVLPYRLDDFNVTLYHSLLRRLTSHYSLMPYHQYSALVEVDWEAYVSVIAQAVLEHLARRVTRSSYGWRRLGGSPPLPPMADIAKFAGAVGDSTVVGAPTEGADVSGTPPTLTKEGTAVTPEAPFNFPEPRRSFTNDLVYHGADRIPPLPSLTRKYLECLVFLHRIGMTANGRRSNMTPGMTPEVLTSILAQPDIQRLVTVLAAREGAPRKDVEAQARRILLQCGDTLNHVHCRTTGLVIQNFFKRIYGRVEVNSGVFERLHRYFAMPRVAVVFVPLHRSYIDFLILSELMAHMQLPLPHVVAGENFLSMGCLATLMRGSGAFFMRRSFRGDPLYAALFKEYVRHLVRARRPVEFFIEGMRSRTGKTMAPKMGLLKFVCDIFYEPGQQELDDVLIMPVSLSYDELLEATTHAQELLGVPKPKENPTNMLKARSLLERKHGNIHVYMSEPVSLRSFRENPRHCPAPFQAKREHLREEAKPPTKTASVSQTLDTTPSVVKGNSITPAPLLATIAWNLVYQLQRNTVITPASMVAAVVECLGPYHSAASTRSTKNGNAVEAASTAAAIMPLEKVQQGVTWLRSILQDRGAKLSLEAAERSPDRIATIGLSSLYRYLRTTDDMSAVVYHPDSVTTRIAVNISTNQLIHVCVDEALIAVVAQAFGSFTTPYRSRPGASEVMLCGMRSVKVDVLKSQTQLLQRLLSVEFPNYAAASPVRFSSWLECTLSQLQRESVEVKSVSSGLSDIESRSGASVLVPVTQYHYFLLQLICPHVEALYAVLVTVSTLLATYPGEPLGAADVVTTTQRVCGTLYAENKLRYVVAANKQTLQNYCESLVACSLLQLKRLPATLLPGKGVKSSSGVMVYTMGSLGKEAALSRLEVLSKQIQNLWWHPSAVAGATIDKAVVQARVLSVYRELTQPSKM